MIDHATSNMGHTEPYPHREALARPSLGLVRGGYRSDSPTETEESLSRSGVNGERDSQTGETSEPRTTPTLDRYEAERTGESDGHGNGTQSGETPWGVTNQGGDDDGTTERSEQFGPDVYALEPRYDGA
jgi:hypothetical protein